MNGKPHCHLAPVGTEAGLDGASKLSGPIGRGVGTAFAPEFYCQPDSQHDFQRFAAQAKKKDVTFRVSAVLPEMLQIREDDLCSLLFNMLDNALEAAAQTEQGEILCSMQIRRQYLAIRCENTYSGTLRTDENGELLTTKDDASDHGFGLMKMRAIAKKYGSVLDISYDENRFTVMTALKLLPEKKNQ